MAIVAVAAVLLLAATSLGGSAKLSAPAFQDGMRKLWEDHATWTRGVIVAVAGDLPNLGASLDRLLRNQDDIGDAIKPFYGEVAGEALSALLRDHIVIAGEILVTAKAGGDPGDALARWYANADDIAAFLNNANPKHWPLEEMRSMLREHLDLTLKEAVAELTGDYAGSVTEYDEVHDAILHMADMLTAGIVKQFPHEFTGVDLTLR